MWGVLFGAFGAVAVIGGFCGLIIWLTWPQNAVDDYHYGQDFSDDDEAGWG